VVQWRIECAGFAAAGKPLAAAGGGSLAPARVKNHSLGMVDRGRAEPAHRSSQGSERPLAARACDWEGCCGEGLYRAPRSRTNLRSYWWFCLEHVRVYNATWNYYAGMNEREIEADLRFDGVWQRPSWPLGSAQGFTHRQRWQDSAFGPGGAPPPPPPVRPLTEADRALIVLDLTPPVTVAIVKARYKILVKRYHPDANGGDKDAEERFKIISEAYRTVMSSLHR
jgi:hypothetical protein